MYNLYKVLLSCWDIFEGGVDMSGQINANAEFDAVRVNAAVMT